MDLFLKKLIISITSRERPNEKGVFLKRIGALLEEGYSMKDALVFLSKIEKDISGKWVVSIQKGMLLGNSFHSELEKLGFPTKVCAQIYFASHYGDYGQTINRCGEQLLKELNQKKKLKSLLTYPLLLLAFLLGMLLMMRFLILPHMEVLFISFDTTTEIDSNWIVQFIYYSPQIILGSLGLLALGVLGLHNKLKKGTVIDGITFFIKLPFLGSYLKDYWTAFFFQEWGELLKNGCSFQEAILIMQKEGASRLLQETGSLLSQQMQLGQSINEALASLPFFHEEAIMVITHGESLGKLSTEMLVYASYCENELTNKMEKLMSKIQPVIFCFIALMIIAIYASLMLPIFSLMEGI